MPELFSNYSVNIFFLDGTTTYSKCSFQWICSWKLVFRQPQNIFMEILPFRAWDPFCKHLFRPENVAIQSPGLIQNCNTVTILLCKYKVLLRKASCMISMCHCSTKNSLLMAVMFTEPWYQTASRWFSQRSVSNHKTMIEKGPHLFHRMSLGKTEEPGKKTETEMSFDFQKTLSVSARSSSALCWWSLSSLMCVYTAMTIQQHGGARGTNSTGQLLRDTHSTPEATGFLGSHYLNWT